MSWTHYLGGERWSSIGLVNAHCHLELSYLGAWRSEVKGAGMSKFIQWIQSQRKAKWSAELNLSAMELACEQMLAEGVVLVGDICNGSDSLAVKNKFNEKIRFVNFIEVFGLRGKRSSSEWSEILELTKLMEGKITVHAPYSCHPDLVQQVRSVNRELQSVHYLESMEEMDFYAKGSQSTMYQTFFSMGIPEKVLNLNHPTNIFSKDVMQYLLVHGVYLEHYPLPEGFNYYICLCPLSNLFLHKRTVEKSFIKRHASRLCLGTDSLATNEALSIVREMNYLLEIGVEPDLIVQMATTQGARALGMPEAYFHAQHTWMIQLGKDGFLIFPYK